MTSASSPPSLPLSNRRRPAADAGSGRSRQIRSRQKCDGATVSDLRAMHEWDGYWPDYGTLVFREAWPGQPEGSLHVSQAAADAAASEFASSQLQLDERERPCRRRGAVSRSRPTTERPESGRRRGRWRTRARARSPGPARPAVVGWPRRCQRRRPGTAGAPAPDRGHHRAGTPARAASRHTRTRRRPPTAPAAQVNQEPGLPLDLCR